EWCRFASAKEWSSSHRDVGTTPFQKFSFLPCAPSHLPSASKYKSLSLSLPLNQSEMDTDEEAAKRSLLVNQFCEIAPSSSVEEALFYLESHNFDLDSALSTFLDSSSTTAAVGAAATATAAPDDSTAAAAIENSLSHSDRSFSPSPPRSRSRSRSRSPSRSRSEDSPVQYNLRSRRQQKQPQQQNARPSIEKRVTRGSTSSRSDRIRTFSDLNKGKSEGGELSDSDSDDPTEYFTGGEKSGMLVQDPSKSDDVDAIFNEARESGAVPEHLHPSSSSKTFTGTARKLSGETVSSVPQQPESITHNITLWSNGFTINDGPLRRLDDPANAPFLESIRKSECPKELEPEDRAIPVYVSLVRRRENYPEPEKRQFPFQGVGRTLGSGSSATATGEAEVAPPVIPPVPCMGLVVDETLPSTSIQLRLADGTRMIARFNHQHRISDIRAFIDASRPDGTRTYQLQTMGFPPKQLTDPNQTIEEAGLANSVVIQRL
ncbi:SEP domain, partial [Dillenia turbinata]